MYTWYRCRGDTTLYTVGLNGIIPRIRHYMHHSVHVYRTLCSMYMHKQQYTVHVVRVGYGIRLQDPVTGYQSFLDDSIVTGSLGVPEKRPPSSLCYTGTTPNSAPSYPLHPSLILRATLGGYIRAEDAIYSCDTITPYFIPVQDDTVQNSVEDSPFHRFRSFFHRTLALSVPCLSSPSFPLSVAFRWEVELRGIALTKASVKEINYYFMDWGVRTI